MIRHDLSLRELSSLVASRAISPVEVVDQSLQQIEQWDSLNAFALVVGEEARGAAREAEREIAQGGYRGPLHGIPVAVKDNIDTGGTRTTGGSRVFRDRVPARPAAVWKLLAEAGAILVGKTNLHEFAYSAPHPDFGPTHNPYRRGFAAGGSSSGSAAAVGAGLVPLALGTDTGGSVRQPAAFCGAVGLKPTPGVLSVDGIFPLAWSLDTAGFFTRDPQDAGLVWDILPRPSIRGEQSGRPTVGIVEVAAEEPPSGTIQNALARAAATLSLSYGEVQPVVLPPLDGAHAAHRVILAAESFAAHRATLATSLSGYGPELLTGLLAGAGLSAWEYLNAQQVRTRYTREVLKIMRDVGILLMPAVSVVAPRLDPQKGRAVAETDLTRWTFLANFVGLPALSVPVGMSEEGLPVAVQLMGARHSERQLLEAAGSLYQRLPVPRAGQ